MKKKLFLAALVALTLIGCEQKQSEMVLDGSVKTATITGKVTWNPNGQLIAADSVEVRAVVPNNEYSAGAAGLKQFAAVRTDKDGNYTIELPVGQITINNVQVEAVPFLADYTDPATGATQQVYYKSELLAVGALKAGDVRDVPISVKPVLTLNNAAKVKISGIVTYDAGIYEVAGGYEKAYKPYANKALKVKGVYTVDGNPFDLELEDVNTNAEGAYELEVPASDVLATITLTTARFDAEFTEITATGDIKKKTVYYATTQHNVNVVALDVEKRNENFTILAYDETPDMTKNLNLKKVSLVVKTLGEEYDEELAGNEELEKYKLGDVFLPFKVRVAFSSPHYDASHANSPIKDNELIFNATASTKDGLIELTDVKLYSAWEGYNIKITVSVEDLLQAMPHAYYEFSGFGKAAYHTKTWADWHKDSDASQPMSAAFWSRCWPSEKKTQQVEGYYHLAADYSETALDADIHYYGEYKFNNDVVLDFVPRDPKLMMGLWSNINYNTRNDKNDAGLYAPFEVQDDAADLDEVLLKTKTTNTQILRHDKYQGVCRADWQARFGLY